MSLRGKIKKILKTEDKTWVEYDTATDQILRAIKEKMPKKKRLINIKAYLNKHIGAWIEHNRKVLDNCKRKGLNQAVELMEKKLGIKEKK